MNLKYFLALSAAFAVVVTSCKKHDGPSIPEISLNPANCHIVSAPGAYSFQAVKGNSSESVGAVASVEVLWESFGTSEIPAKGDIVAEAKYSASDGQIHFKTPSKLKDGNALIAAKDASGNILWSWHLWVCDGWDPEKTAHVYYNDSGVMMDRNLGATSAVPGDVRALGLLYQWGRKDPFLGSSDINEKVVAGSTLNWPNVVLSSPQTGTIAYTIAHPTTFIASEEDNYDWYYTGENDTDNTRWQSDKTIYDPCPSGWRLPTGPTPTDAGFWYNTYHRQTFIMDMDVANRGQNFTKVYSDANPVWYPLAGLRAGDDGRLWAVGKECGYWTSAVDLDPADPDARVMAMGLNMEAFNDTEIGVFTAADYFRSNGLSVRCVVDK